MVIEERIGEAGAVACVWVPVVPEMLVTVQWHCRQRNPYGSLGSLLCGYLHRQSRWDTTERMSLAR